MTMEVRNSPTTATSSSSTNPNLEGLCRGSKGGDVITLQKALNERGAQLDVDGKFGPLTEAALQKFQKDAGCGGAGKVDAGTVKALQTPAAAASTATTAPTTTATPAPAKEAPTAQTQTEARRKTLGGEDLVRARLDGVAGAQKKGEQFQVLSEDNVKQITTQLEGAQANIGQQRAALADKRKGVEADVAALEAKPNRSVPEEALLTGKKGQVNLLRAADQHLADQHEVIGAAMTAVGDGVATESEGNAIITAQTALNRQAQALTQMDAQTTQLVTHAEQAGAAVPGKPASSSTASTATAASTAAAASSSEAAAPTLAEVKAETAGLRKQMNQQRADLSILKSAPPKDPAAKAAFNAEVGLKEHELSLTQRRIADLGKAEEVLGKGPLSADDAKALATSKQQFEAQTTLLKQGKQAFTDVAGVEAAMTKASGSPEAYVAGKQTAVDDAQAALKRAQTRGEPEAIRAASANLGKASADLDVAKASKSLVDETRKALSDGQLNETEAAGLQKVGANLTDATSRSEAFAARQPELESKKSFGSDLKDRVVSWFTNAPATGEALLAKGRSLFGL